MAPALTSRHTWLRLLPVLSSTASVVVALSEYQALLPWLNHDIPSESLSPWFDSWFRLVLAGILALEATSVVGGYMGWKGTIGKAKFQYKFGTILALGHFVFAPTIAQCIKRLVYGPTDAKEELQWWLTLHTVRTVTTDIPAMLCFLYGYLNAIQ
ncbi:hypothetical protein BJ138DRAFT_1149662 [Hygrophoropsis aurantiaca]|uniref:Uncharacterized protein n=1 Tax=Hygrophoropsis aurantiaca TaxID=72124 RepID=A0ACB8AFV8_9AGAM|nr:hypothetical protein BJ138DRAFT_1149662 [Hygrophoropsis aurantiaca]